MFMSYKDKAYYKLNKIGDINCGKTLYWLHWFNTGILILNLILGNYVTVFICGAFQAANIYLWCKGRDSFCRNLEKSIISQVIGAKIDRFGLQYPELSREEVTEKYIAIADVGKDLELVDKTLKEFYKSL